MKYNLWAIGTNAHEIYMIIAALFGENDKSLEYSHSFVISKWYEMYGEELSIALTDTFGTDFFLRDFSFNAERYKGLRHDSGDPFKFGDKVIKYYKGMTIEAKEKLIVFSDGLDVYKILKLFKYFSGKIRQGFGWGTTLTNDLGFETLSIVMKATRVVRNEGKVIDRSTVKLSDNINKSMGDPVEVIHFVLCND